MIQARDADTAKTLDDVALNALKAAGQTFGDRPPGPDFAKDLDALKPRLIEDRIDLA